MQYPQLKIYQINVVANSGSTGRITEGIITKAMKLNYTCYLAYGRWANHSKADLFKIGSKFDIYYHAAVSMLLDKHGLASKNATKKLIKDLTEKKPDIIHLHNIHGYYLNYPILFNFLSKLNIPIIWTLHDCWSYTGHCAYYTAVNCEKWKKGGCNKCLNLKEYPLSLWKDSSQSNFILKREVFTSVKDMTIITVSDWLKKEVEQSFLSKYKIKTIHNGVDINKFYPLSLEKKNTKWHDKFIILGVATVWSTRKGLDDFIKLSQNLANDEIIILIGLSKKQIKQLPFNIIGIEKTENIKELVSYYSIADLYINFSIEETFGMTTIESMACGTPALVVNSTASPEIVNDDVGFVIEPHDINAAKNIIALVKKNTKKYYSEKCRSYVVKKYNEEDRFNEYIELYQKVLVKK